MHMNRDCEAATLFERLLPIVPVTDVEAETAFYGALGFTATLTHTGFTALRCGPVLFGVQKSDQQVPPADLAWQIEVTDIRAAHALAVRQGLEVVSEPELHPVGFWALKLRTPNGYTLTCEGPERSSAT
jgi:predicted enzyme related to lactoylglutathione lyase